MKRLVVISAISAMLFGVAGMADGVTQALLFHYPHDFFTNEAFWNPYVSWVNKYDVHGHAKFFGSTTFLVFVTDGYHLARFIHDVFLCLGWVVISLGTVVLWSHMKIYMIPYTLALCYVAKVVGFHIIYTFVF